MTALHKKYTQHSRPANLPVDLDAGRLDVMRFAAAVAFALGCLVVALVGVGLVVWFPRAGWFGGAVVVVAAAFGGVAMWIVVAEALAYQRFIADARALTLENYAQNSQEIEASYSEWHLRPGNLRDELIAALWIQHQIELDPSVVWWSVRRLSDEELRLGVRRLGAVTYNGAHDMLSHLADRGLIVGRSERQAGRWSAGGYDEVIEAFL